MNFESWNAVDRYYADLLIDEDAVLIDALRRSSEAGLPQINVAANQGKLLHLLAKMCSAKRILEIGTLGGYSTIWLARALPKDGKLITLEFEAKHAAVARENLRAANLDSIVEVRQGLAIELLEALQTENVEPFDFIFIDADKQSAADYFKSSLKLSKIGSVIIVDNVVRDGMVIDAENADDRVQGIRRFNEVLSKESRVSATALQTVGSKGYDGFVLARVSSELHAGIWKVNVVVLFSDVTASVPPCALAISLAM